MVRVGFNMNAQDVAILFWAFATLGWELGVEVRATLEAGAYTRSLLSSTCALFMGWGVHVGVV